MNVGVNSKRFGDFGRKMSSDARIGFSYMLSCSRIYAGMNAESHDGADQCLVRRRNESELRPNYHHLKRCNNSDNQLNRLSDGYQNNRLM